MSAKLDKGIDRLYRDLVGGAEQQETQGLDQLALDNLAFKNKIENKPPIRGAKPDNERCFRDIVREKRREVAASTAAAAAKSSMTSQK